MTTYTHNLRLAYLSFPDRLVLAELLVTEHHYGHRIHKIKLGDKLVLTKGLKAALSEAFGFVDYCASFRGMDGDMVIIFEDMMN